MADSAQSPWCPLLQGLSARQALAVAEEIGGDLLALRAVNSAPFGLTGLAGWSLFFAYLDRAVPGHGYLDRAAELLEDAVAGTGRSHSLASLHAGFPGVAWLVEHLKGWLLEDDAEDDPGEAIAAALCDHLGRSPWNGDYDLLLGLAGLGVYALERAPRRWGRECLERAVARLAETAERRPEGAAWKWSPEAAEPEMMQQYPEGNYNMGVAHGAPGVAAFLALASAAGVAARPLLDESVAWILAQRLPAGERSIFPHVVAPGQPPPPTRLAWCYGDLGVAAALLVAARCTGEAAWEREALATARAAAGRSPEYSGVVDAGLCHGAAGNAHVFNRISQATGDPACEQAARFWLERALALRRPGEGVGGYFAWDAGDQRKRAGWQEDPRFLSGAAGIGLALLAAASPVEPAWDRLLLTAIPPRGSSH
jgi:hypothetical protein